MKLKYCLGATMYFSRETMRQATSLIPFPTFLSKMGINPTTATDVRHGPTSLLSASMNILHLENEQAVEHTKLMVSHLRKKEDEVGRMLQRFIDQLQIQAGTSCAVLSRPGKKARMYVDQCYTSHMGIP
jgi:hypothetical protein